jgi:aspartyl-tRNA(Asn)/glutamyl-tRNA(Gln) amidotransferase subunit C
MKISREEVIRVADLAHLELAPDEVETYRGQLDAILTYIDKLKELDVAEVEPMAQVTFRHDHTPTPHTHTYGESHRTQPNGAVESSHPELRDDKIFTCNTAADLFIQAPDAARPFFRVPKVIER